MEALKLFEEMLQKGLQPNVITYNALISACGKFAMTAKALHLFEEMQKQGLQPKVITYTAVITTGGMKSGMTMRACSSLRRCRSRDFSPMRPPAVQ